jgi:hypothetical protein
MRGAGANFGVAVDFEFEAVPVGDVAFAQLTFAVTDVAEFLENWGIALEASDRTVTATVLLGATRRGRANYAQATVVVDSGDSDVVLERLQPILRTAPLAQRSVAMASYEEVMGAYLQEGRQQGVGEPLSHSAFARHLDPELSSELAAMLESGASHFFTIRSVGGAISDVPSQATAYGWRDANFALVALGSPDSGLDAWWARLSPSFEGMYLSFESDTGPENLAVAFPPAHLTRLRGLKRTYDPSGLFRDNFFIDPDVDTE